MYRFTVPSALGIAEIAVGAPVQFALERGRLSSGEITVVNQAYGCALVAYPDPIHPGYPWETMRRFCDIYAPVKPCESVEVGQHVVVRWKYGIHYHGVVDWVVPPDSDGPDGIGGVGVLVDDPDGPPWIACCPFDDILERRTALVGPGF